MKVNTRLLLIYPATIFLASCATFAPAPTATPTLTATPRPTSTVPPTPLPPTATLDVVAAILPTGQPAVDWNGIPIMPGALAGEGDAAGYTFSTLAAPAQVQGYYATTLAGLGWSTFAAGQGQTGAILLFYMKGSEMLTISIIPGDGITVVLLVK